MAQFLGRKTISLDSQDAGALAGSFLPLFGANPNLGAGEGAPYTYWDVDASGATMRPYYWADEVTPQSRVPFSMAQTEGIAPWMQDTTALGSEVMRRGLLSPDKLVEYLNADPKANAARNADGTVSYDVYSYDDEFDPGQLILAAGMAGVGALSGGFGLSQLARTLGGSAGGSIGGTSAQGLAAADIAGGLVPEFGTHAAYNAGVSGGLTGQNFLDPWDLLPDPYITYQTPSVSPYDFLDPWDLLPDPYITYQTPSVIPYDSPFGIPGPLMPPAVPETPAQLKEWGLKEVSPGRWEMPAFPGEGFTFSQAANFARSVAGLLSSGDTSVLSTLLKYGLPAAAIAGLFEKSNNPLMGPMTQGAIGALEASDRFKALPAVPQTASQRRAIALANENVGVWKPYMDKAGALTDTAAAGLTPERVNALMNPYVRGVLDPQLRDINEAADRRGQDLRALVSRSGNDFRSPVGTRFNIEDQLLDRERLRAVSDASGKAYADAFNYATANAGKDLDRVLLAGRDFATDASRVGALGAGDVSTLKEAGALEQEPYRNALAKESDTAKLYTGVVHGNTGAMKSVEQPSLFMKATGALGALGAGGALKSAKDLGIL